MRTKAIIAAGLAALTIAVAGCSEATEEQRQGLQKVRIGDTPSQVVQKVGQPDNKQRFESANPIDGSASVSECWYWGIDQQVCFDDGKVTSKNDY